MNEGAAVRAQHAAPLRNNKHKPYPAYKPSGVAWLGDIPTHWHVTPIKRLAKQGYKTFVDGDWIESPFITNEGVRLLQTGNVGIGDFKEQGFRYISEETFIAFDCTEVLPGDVLICRLAEPVGRACLAPSLGVHMITSVDVCILKLNDAFDSRFVVYFLSSERYLGWMQALCRGGTHDRVSRSMLGAIQFVVPPFPEQRAIAAYLDRETTRIDALIAKKERLIELLQEKHAALISHAVTRGLDANAPLKDSGSAWLGQVPAHWEVLSVKQCARRVQTGATPPTAETQYYEEGTVPWFGPGSFGNDLLLKEPVKLISEQAAKDGVARIFESGSTMIVTIGATIGKVGYLENSASSNQQITAITFDTTRVFPKFAAYQMKRLEPVLRGIAPNTTLPILDQEEIGYLPFTLPPLDEQRAIAAHIDRETTKIDALIAKARAVIENLQEYRTALISAAVTGKIDVSGL